MLLCLIQTWSGGYPIQTWSGGYPSRPGQSGYPGYPPPSRPGWGLPHPDLVGGGFPIQTWLGVPWVPSDTIQTWSGEGTPHPNIQTWDGVPPHPDLRWVTPQDLRWGNPPGLGWGTPLPRPGMWYPPYPDLRWGTPLPLQVWTKWKYNLPSSFGCGR